MLSHIISNPQPHPRYQICLITQSGRSGTILRHLYTSPRTGATYFSRNHANNYTHEQATAVLQCRIQTRSSSLNMISITVRQMNAVTSRIICAHKPVHLIIK